MMRVWNHGSDNVLVSTPVHPEALPHSRLEQATLWPI
jgi:hypothetical protein